MTCPKFPKGNQFYIELQRRLSGYFQESGKQPRDCPRMYWKTGLILAWFFTCYALLLLVDMTWWQALPVVVLLGVATAAIGFNVQHDAGHQAYSEKSWINRLLASTLDLVGGSSYYWHFKHGIYHHTFTNIDGHDSDIDLGFLGRLSPHQRRYWFHRWQHFYIWPFYGLVVIKWQLFDDFFTLITGRIGNYRVPFPGRWDLAIFLVGKLLFITLAFVLPLCFHPWWLVLTCYGLAMLVTGVVLSVVFQLAHCLEPAAFPLPSATNHMEHNWAVHQVETTVNFAPRSRVLTWLLGGLNYQIEHHLFPRVCHTHYPALAGIVRRTCAEFGLAYHVYDTFWEALRAHFRWLRLMGSPGPAS
jgi:linoleoyl-CoA desaturase